MDNQNIQQPTEIDTHLAEVYQFFYNDNLPNLETQAIQDRIINRAAAIQDFVNSPPIPFVLPTQLSDSQKQSCQNPSSDNSSITSSVIKHRSLKQFWQDEQIKFLNDIKRSHPELSYSNIANMMNQRFGCSLKANQVHQRWQRVQNPDIHKGKWTESEDQSLINSYNTKQELHYLCLNLPHRSSFQIKNRCLCLKLELKQE